MADATVSGGGEPADRPDPRYFDVGHQGEFDRPQIAARLAMTPAERLRNHEGWHCSSGRPYAVQNFAETVIAALAEGGCEFAVAGGLSAVLHGAPIVTQDLDVCYRRARPTTSPDWRPR